MNANTSTTLVCIWFHKPVVSNCCTFCCFFLFTLAPKNNRIYVIWGKVVNMEHIKFQNIKVSQQMKKYSLERTTAETMAMKWNEKRENICMWCMCKRVHFHRRELLEFFEYYYYHMTVSLSLFYRFFCSTILDTVFSFVSDDSSFVFLYIA